MQDLRVAEIRTLSELGAQTFLEVGGKLVMRQARRLYDHANHPDPMMDVEEAQVRFHTQGSSSPWQAAPGLSVNRDRVLLIAPRAARDATSPLIRGQSRQLQVSLLCGPLQVSGTVTMPLDSGLVAYLHQSPARFLAVARPRVRPHNSNQPLGDFQADLPMCYVNTARIDAAMEAVRQAATAATSAGGQD